MIGAPREHLSFSALRQLQTCGLQFRLQRIDGVPPSHRNASLFVGSVYHQVLGYALSELQGGRTVSSEELQEHFDACWKAELTSPGEAPVRWTVKASEKSQRELCLGLCRAWHEQGLPRFAEAERILAVELPFQVPIVSREGEVLETPLEGFIDALVQKADESVVAVDHKTSSSSQTYGEPALELDLQSTAYTYAARQLGHEGCEFEYHVMSKSKRSPGLSVIPVRRTEEDFDRLFAIARTAERIIAAGLFLPAAPGWQCETCAWRDACVEAFRRVRPPVRHKARRAG